MRLGPGNSMVKKIGVISGLMEFIVFADCFAHTKKPKLREATAKDCSASKEPGWDLNPGLLALTLRFSQLLPTGFHGNWSHSKTKVRVLEFITEETDHWSWPLALAVGIWN